MRAFSLMSIEDRVKYLNENHYVFTTVFKLANMLFIAFIVGFIVMMVLDFIKNLLCSQKLQ